MSFQQVFERFLYWKQIYFSAFLCKCLGILHHTIIHNTYVMKWWFVEFELSILLTQKCWYQRKMRTVFVVTCESALVCFTSSGSKFLNLGSTFRDFSTSSFYCSKQQGSASSFLAVSLPSQSEAFTVVKVSVVYSLLCWHSYFYCVVAPFKHLFSAHKLVPIDWNTWIFEYF